MKHNLLRQFSLYVPAMILLLFSFVFYGNSVNGPLICVEGFYPYVSTDIFGEYTFLSSDQVVAYERVAPYLKDNPSSGEVFVSFEPSIGGKPSLIRDITNLKKPGYIPASVYLNEDKSEYHLQLSMDKVRLQSNDTDLPNLSGQNDGETRYYYYFHLSGTQIVLDSVKVAE